MNHGVELNGFHIHSSDGDYLLVRNSWGVRWGESGYIKLDTVENSGADLDAAYPVLEGMTLPRADGQGKPITKDDMCKDDEIPDPALNCDCTYGGTCDRSKPTGENGCKEECGCGEFGFCR